MCTCFNLPCTRLTRCSQPEARANQETLLRRQQRFWWLVFECVCLTWELQSTCPRSGALCQSSTNCSRFTLGWGISWWEWRKSRMLECVAVLEANKEETFQCVVWNMRWLQCTTNLLYISLWLCLQYVQNVQEHASRVLTIVLWTDVVLMHYVEFSCRLVHMAPHRATAVLLHPLQRGLAHYPPKLFCLCLPC